MHKFDWLVRGLAFVALLLLWEHIVEALFSSQGKYVFTGAAAVMIFRLVNTRVSAVAIANTVYLIHVFMDGVLAAVLSARFGASAGWAVEGHAVAHGCTLLLASMGSSENRKKGFLLGCGVQVLALTSFLCGTASVVWSSYFTGWLPAAALGSAVGTLALLLWKPCVHNHTHEHITPQGI